MLLVGDSTLGGFVDVPQAKASLRGFVPILDARPCRRLARPSCRSAFTNVVPNTAVEAIAAATACHEWAEVPGTQQAVVNPAVGTTHETSPTSVEPVPTCPVRSATRPRFSSGGRVRRPARVLRIPAANSANEEAGVARRAVILTRSSFALKRSGRNSAGGPSRMR